MNGNKKTSVDADYDDEEDFDEEGHFHNNDLDEPDDEVDKVEAAPKAKAKKPKKSKAKTAPNTTGLHQLKPRATVEKTAPKPVKVKPEKAELDRFGLRVNTVRSKAAALYARAEGATLEEVRDQVGSIQYNVLTLLKKRGCTVDEKQEAGSKNRTVTRFFLK